MPDAEEAKAQHRLYLGMAPGVGKTYAALLELRRRKQEGTDAVVAFVETYNRRGTIEALDDLEIVARRKIPYKGLVLEDMDLDAVLARKPRLALVDELAHTNAPGSRHEKRWQDVRDLLAAGISVFSTLNIQHLESLADIVAAITGTEVRERIPDKVVDEADEIELIDLSPRALRQRIEQGEVYPKDLAEQSLRKYFREGNLLALRELAVREVATEVEKDLESSLRSQDTPASWQPAERVLVGVTDRDDTQALLRRGWRMSNRIGSDLLATFIETPDWSSAPPRRQRALAENLRFAEELGAKVVRAQDTDVARGLLRVARENNVTQVVVGHSRRGRLQELLGGSSVPRRLLELADDIDVHVVAVHETS